MNILFPALILGLCSIRLLTAAEPVLGVPPESLLALLPKAPEGGKLTKSIGHNEISPFPALLTFALRDYVEVPPAATPDQPAPLPKITKITLLDTAWDPDRAFVFDVFRPEAKADPSLKRFARDGTSILEQIQESSRRRVLIPIENRFLLSLVLENQDDRDRDRWLDRLDLPRLVLWARSAPRLPLPPRKFTVARINELDPKMNRTTSVPYLTQAQAEAQTNRERQEDRESAERMKKILSSSSN